MAKLSKLARMGSGSAARSVIGGVAALPVGRDTGAMELLSVGRIPWGMVIALVDTGPKQIGSREVWSCRRQKSPYYKAWLGQSRKDYRAMLAAVRRLDFTEVGEIAEANALAMHACMMATRPSLIYWRGATIELIAFAQRMRRDGIETYITIDAGPNVVFFCKLPDIERVRGAVADTRLAKSVIVCRPAVPRNRRTRMTKVIIPGKVMLSGEYAVLRGWTAVLIPVPRSVIISECASESAGSLSRLSIPRFD